MKILKFSDFVLNEESELKYNLGIPFYRGTSFNPERVIKRNKLLNELQDLLRQVANGEIKEVTVIAEIPTFGKNMPQYLKDIYAEMGYDPTEIRRSSDDEDEDLYDPETDVYIGKKGGAKNIFVDSEFIVKDVDQTRDVIIAVPYSLRKKGAIVEISPDVVDEAYIK